MGSLEIQASESLTKDWVATRGVQLHHVFGIIFLAVLALATTWGFESVRPADRGPFLYLYLFVIAIVAVGWLAAWNRVPRKIGITATGVEFVYPLSRVTLAWNQLQLPRYVGLGYVLFRPVPGTAGVRPVPLWVTVPQAQALARAAGKPEWSSAIPKGP
jgi:hypothetical protein